VTLGLPNHDRRARRHEATKAEIVVAAWEVARHRGLAGLTLAEVAARVDMRVPSLYQYFASKNDLYDAMFAQGNDEFLAFLEERRAELPTDARQRLRAGFRLYFEFCTSDPARYQLLFQRTVPGFEPSPASYAKAVEVMTLLREDLARAGLVHDQEDEDLLTALSSGLVDQQIANDPGGDRWARLIDVVADMAYDHLKSKQRRKGRQGARRPAGKSTQGGPR
jgi:AcrR family transcriptional regulator